MKTTNKNTLAWANPSLGKPFALSKPISGPDTEFKKAKNASELSTKHDLERSEYILNQLDAKQTLKDKEVGLLAKFGGELAKAKIESHEFSKLANKVETALGKGKGVNDDKDFDFIPQVIGPVIDLAAEGYAAKGDHKSAVAALKLNDQGQRNKALKHILDHTSQLVFEKAWDKKFTIDGGEWSLADGPPAAIERKIRQKIESAIITDIIKGGQFSKNEVLQLYMLPAYERIENGIITKGIEENERAKVEYRRKRNENFINLLTTTPVGTTNTAVSGKLETIRQGNKIRKENGVEEINLGGVLRNTLGDLLQLAKDQTIKPDEALQAVINSGSVTIGDRTYKNLSEVPDYKKDISNFITKLNGIKTELININEASTAITTSRLSNDIIDQIVNYKGQNLNEKIIAPFYLTLAKSGPGGTPLQISDLSDRAQSLLTFGTTKPEAMLKYLHLKEALEAGHVIDSKEFENLPPDLKAQLKELNNGNLPNTQQQQWVIQKLLSGTLLNRTYLNQLELNPIEQANLEIEARAWIFNDFNKTLKETGNTEDSMRTALENFQNYFDKNLKGKEGLKLAKEWAKSGLKDYSESSVNFFARMNEENKYIKSLEKINLKDLTSLLARPTQSPGETLEVTDELRNWIEQRGGNGPPPVWYVRMSEAMGGIWAANPGLAALERAKTLGIGDPKQRVKAYENVVNTGSEQLRDLNNSSKSSNVTKLAQSTLKNGGIDEDTDKACFGAVASVSENPYDYVDTSNGKPLQINDKDINVSELNLSQINDIIRAGNIVRGWGAYNIKSDQLLNLFRDKDFQQHIGLINPEGEADPSKQVNPILFNKETQIKIRDWLIKHKSWNAQTCNGSFLTGYRPVFQKEVTLTALGIDLDPNHPNHPNNISSRLFEVAYLTT